MTQSGIEILIHECKHLLKGCRIGLLCHAPSVDSNLNHASDLIKAAGANLTCLFGPEHGLWGAEQDMIGVSSSIDTHHQIPVHSLYGKDQASLCPHPDALEALDLLIIDFQDIGSRYYTYIWTMIMAIQACASAKKRVLVLDRVNPLNGVQIEGPSIQPGFASFVGLHPIPVRHGLTLGEIARLVSVDLDLNVDLHIIPLKGWDRRQFFDETGLPWILPSPNMPTFETALVYPGACLIEGTNLSEGRGTTKPFEIIGAPWVNGWTLKSSLEKLSLPGVKFRPTQFCPAFHKYAHKVCGGIQIHITHRLTFQPLKTAVAVLQTIHHLWPDAFAWRTEPYEFVANRLAIDLLAGGDWLRNGIEQESSLEELTCFWPQEEAQFAQRRKAFLLYRH